MRNSWKMTGDPRSGSTGFEGRLIEFKRSARVTLRKQSKHCAGSKARKFRSIRHVTCPCKLFSNKNLPQLFVKLFLHYPINFKHQFPKLEFRIKIKNFFLKR